MKIRVRLAAALLGLAALAARAPAADEDAPKGKAGVRAVPNGPVHEAFAQPARLPTTPPPLLDEAPPEPLDEQVPDEKPDLDGVQWIPGYWDYSPPEKDYVWASGVWRVPPPDRQWVDGYWNDTKGKWQRVRGYWAAYVSGAAGQQVDYLPAPPAPKDETPGDPPEAGSVWTPGSWDWNGPTNEYVWEAGSWTAPQPGWSWVGPSFNWTPGGYAPSGGYWDYAPSRRGVAFAPVVVPRAVRTRPGYTYLPTLALPPATVTNYLTGPQTGPQYTYVNPRYVNFKTAPRIKRVVLDPAARVAEAKLARELAQVGNLRRRLENEIVGPRTTPRRVGLALPKVRVHKRVEPPTHPRHHRVVDRARPRPGAIAKKRPDNRITRKVVARRPPSRAGSRDKPGLGKSAGKKVAKSGKAKKGGKKKSAGKAKKGASKAKKGGKKKGGKAKKSGKKKGGKAKKSGKKKGGKAKKGGKKKGGKKKGGKKKGGKKK